MSVYPRSQAGEIARSHGQRPCDALTSRFSLSSHVIRSLSCRERARRKTLRAGLVLLVRSRSAASEIRLAAEVDLGWTSDAPDAELSRTSLRTSAPTATQSASRCDTRRADQTCGPDLQRHMPQPRNVALRAGLLAGGGEGVGGDAEGLVRAAGRALLPGVVVHHSVRNHLADPRRHGADVAVAEGFGRADQETDAQARWPEALPAPIPGYLLRAGYLRDGR